MPLRRAALVGWIVSLVLVAVAVPVAALLPERCGEITEEDLEETANGLAGWLIRNQRPDGTYLYLYDAEADRLIDDYNIVRHAGVTLSLYQAAAANIDGALEAADRGRDWALDNLTSRADWVAFHTQGDLSTGASALLVAALVERRELTGETRDDGVLQALGRFIAESVEPRGSVIASFDASTGEPVAGDYSPFFTGEVFWALARLHTSFPDAGWEETARPIGGYLATTRDEAEGYWPDLIDHWAGYAFDELTRWPGLDDDAEPLTGDEVAYVDRQARLFGATTRYESQRTGSAVNLLLRGGPTSASGLGAMGEGLTGFWRTSGEDERLQELQPLIGERAVCVADRIRDRQVTPAEAEDYPRPDLARGAIFREGLTQMDTQQHALSATLRTRAIVASGDLDGGGAAPGSEPAAWLLLLAFVGVVNPARFLRPDQDRKQTAVAAAVTLAAVTIGALLADPLLDAIGFSRPNLRIAAGVALLIAAARDLFLTDRAPMIAHGRFGTLPALLRPELLVLALSAGADRGVLITVVAALVALGAAVAIPPTAASPTWRTWLMRLVAVALAVVAVELLIDGVFDV